MKYLAMLDRLDWSLKSNGDLDRLEKILFSYRKTVLSTQGELNECEYTSFWNDVIERNIYMASLLVTRAKNLFGKEDECVKSGKMAIFQSLRDASFNENYFFRLLAEIESEKSIHLKEYVHHSIGNDALTKHLSFLEYSSKFPDNVVCFLKHALSYEFSNNHTILNAILSLKWKIDADDIKSKSDLTGIITFLFDSNDTISLSILSRIFDGFSLIEFSEKSLDEWKALLNSEKNKGYISMMLYKNILSTMDMTSKERLDELYSFTYWANGDSDLKINCYIFFAYAICYLPEKFDYYADFFKNGPSFNELDMFVDSLSDASKRQLNNMIIDTPFRLLIQNNPKKIPEFLEIMGTLSLYHYSKNEKYRKWTSWVKENEIHLNEYKHFIDYACDTYESKDVINIYMNSPLKSTVDFSYVIRKLFMPDTGWKYLTPHLGNYTFRGTLIKNAGKGENVSYSVTMSNVSSTYVFPIHQTWVQPNKENLSNNFSNGDVVYFKLLSLNSHGMIFAYDLTKRVLEASPIKQTCVTSFAFKNMDKILNQSLPLQGNNVDESIKMYVVAIVHNDTDNILVEKVKMNDKVMEYLPCLPISNYESSNATLKRLLKYHMGFNKDICFAPCGIRHICNGRDKRSIFYIYKVNLNEIKEEQSALAMKNNFLFKNIEDFKVNINDDITRSIVDAYNTSWSEYTILI